MIPLRLSWISFLLKRNFIRKLVQKMDQQINESMFDRWT